MVFSFALIYSYNADFRKKRTQKLMCLVATNGISGTVNADEIRVAELRQYTLENSETLLRIGETLQSLINVEQTEYPIGWGTYDEERRVELQDYENTVAQRQNREPFELVQPVTFLELNKATDDLLYELIQRISEGYYDERPTLARDPYDDPFADRDAVVPREEVRLVLPSPPLYFYTDRARANALISLRRFAEVNDDLLAFEVQVADGFFWHEVAQLQGGLGIVWEHFWDLLLDIIIYLRETGLPPLRRWNLATEITEWIYGIRDVEVEDDEPDRPDWREYDRQGLMQMFANFQEMYLRLNEVHEQWEQAARAAFRPPILRDHPDIVPIYDLVKQQNRYAEFYLKMLGRLRSALHRLPQLFPTRQAEDDEYDNL
ncbi:hypothetical protein ABW21_db0206976 [Orbilia brochopaga]|nr:hypothetical protein ABW21_db0206976 [Drechslerella brochopaga]